MQVKVHKLKISHRYFADIICAGKRFELRKDDRGYSFGDVIRLREIENGEYTGAAIEFTITYVLRGCPEYGLMSEYCILGFDHYSWIKQ